MPRITNRHYRWLLVAVVAVFVAVSSLRMFFFGPSPEDAREALAAAGWCDPDSPITRHDNGLVHIGTWECNLFERRWYPGRNVAGTFTCTFSWSRFPFCCQWIASATRVQ